jgi:hypothetical protein
VQTTSGRRWLSCLHKLLGSLHLAEAFLTAITPHHLLLMIGSDATPSGDRHTPAQLIKVGFDWISFERGRGDAGGRGLEL